MIKASQLPRRADGFQPIVSILIVSYNTREMTLACISSAFEQTRSSFEIIVVDNASSDGSADAIENDFPSVRLIRSRTNLGFAKANNLAAQTANGEFLLLLNPDTVVLDRAVDHLIMFASERSEAGIWGGRTIFADGTLNPTSCWRFMSLWSLFAAASGLTTLWRASFFLNPEGYGGWHRDCVREVDIVTGCLFLIRHDLWKRLQGFDENFFMYAEEADLCYRARKVGARPMMTPEATIIHYDGASERLLSAKLIKLLSGKVLFIKKHWPRWKSIVGVLLLEALVLVRALGITASGALTGSASRRLAAQEWRQVWSARGSWRRGYEAGASS